LKLSNSDKIILDLCGGTGAWSKPYKDAGYDVRLITLPEYDVRTYKPPNNVYGILAAPPCTMFSIARTRAKSPRDLREGMEIVIACLNIIWACQYDYKQEYGYKTSLKFWALENPHGFLRYFLGKEVFTFQPYQFGDPYSKKTCLWGNFISPKILPLFVTTKKVDLFHKGKIKDIKKYKSISDITLSSRQDLRAITPPGFAKAFFEANR